MFVSMSKLAKTGTMTDLLRKALRECPSLRELERETGVNRLSAARFLKGQTSLRLDVADRLAEYFGIECRRKG